MDPRSSRPMSRAEIADAMYEGRISPAEAGRRRRELAELDAALDAGHPAPHTVLSLGPDRRVGPTRCRGRRQLGRLTHRP